MTPSTTAKILLGLTTGLLLAGCGDKQRLSYAEESCSADGVLYVVQLQSSSIAAAQEAVLRDTDSDDIVERADALIMPTHQSLVFSSKRMSYHGFGSTSQSIDYKDLSGITYDADDETMIVDRIVVSPDDGQRSVEEQQLPGVSVACHDNIVTFLNQQSVAM